MRIFISSVMKELRKERKVVEDAIYELNREPYSSLIKNYLQEKVEFQPVRFENFGARTSSSKDLYLKAIESSNIYVGILGKRYGVIQESGLSATHEEYRKAKSIVSDKGIEILVYVKNIHSGREPKVNDFIDEISETSKGHSYSSYTNEFDLRDKVKRDILNVIVGIKDNEQEIVEEKISKIIKEILDKESPKPSYDDVFLKSKIYELISILKIEIDKFNMISVEFFVKELIYNLHTTRLNLFSLISDIVDLGFSSSTRRVPFTIVSTVESIMFKNCFFDGDVSLAEKCSDILLRIAISNLDRDLDLAKSCFYTLSNIAGDMFVEQIFSRILILGAYIDENNSSSIKLQNLENEILHHIKVNDQYAHDAEFFDYLIQSMIYAKKIQDSYSIEIEAFLEKYVHNIILEIKSSLIDDYVSDFDQEITCEEDFEYSADYLTSIIWAYKEFYPDICSEIFDKIKETNDSNKLNNFNKVLKADQFLEVNFGDVDLDPYF